MVFDTTVEEEWASDTVAKAAISAALRFDHANATWRYGRCRLTGFEGFLDYPGVTTGTSASE